MVKGLGLPVTRSIIQIDGIESNPSNEGAIVTSFSLNDSEKNSVIQCFGGVNHVYAFGRDPEQSAFSVSYLVFLGSKCMRDDTGGFKPGNYLDKIVKNYNSIRVSESSNTVIMSIGNGVSYTGVVLSMNAAVHDPELNTISVTISGKIVQSW